MRSQALPLSPVAVTVARRMTLIIGWLIVITPFSTDMYLSSFPTLAGVFHASPEQVQATLSFFIIGVALGQLFVGPLADRFGRRRPLIAGFSLFVLTSVMIVWTSSIQSLSVLRLLQAVGACTGMVVGRAVVRDLFEGREVAGAMSVIMMIQSVGPIVAPVLGAYVFALAGWRANFWVLAACGLVALAAIVWGLPETLAPGQRRSAHPLAALQTYAGLLRQPDFLLPLAASSAAVSALFTYISCSPYVMLQTFGVSVRHYGWIFGLIAAASVLSAQLNRYLLRRVQAPRILAWVLPINALAGIALVASVGLHSLTALLPPLWLFIGSVPMIVANATALAMGPTRGRAGSASSLIGVLQWSCASVVSLVAVSFHNGTAYPMSIGMCACALLGWTAFVFARRLPAAG